MFDIVLNLRNMIGSGEQSYYSRDFGIRNPLLPSFREVFYLDLSIGRVEPDMHVPLKVCRSSDAEYRRLMLRLVVILLALEEL